VDSFFFFVFSAAHFCRKIQADGVAAEVDHRGVVAPMRGGHIA